jgi:hypothetical protein
MPNGSMGGMVQSRFAREQWKPGFVQGLFLVFVRSWRRSPHPSARMEERGASNTAVVVEPRSHS